MAKHPLVYIEWIDSISNHAWHDLKQYQNAPDRVKTVGWIVAESKEAKTIVASMTSWMGSGDMTIPASCIRRIVKLREPK